VSAGLWLLAGAVLLVLVVILEGRRQARIYGRGSGRSSLARTGLLELQRHLEPERRVEMLIDERDETEQDDSGEGPPRAR
jgi:hypothetical protein